MELSASLFRPKWILPKSWVSKTPWLPRVSTLTISRTWLLTASIQNPSTSVLADDGPKKIPSRNMASKDLVKETEEALGWGSVCSQLAAFTSTAAGRALCLAGGVPLGRERWESERLLEQTKAAVELAKSLDFSGVEDVEEIVRAAVDGQLLTVRDICVVERSLRAARGVLEQLEKASSDGGGALESILRSCDFLTEMVEDIGFCLDCTLFTVLDRASAELESTRSERRGNMEKLQCLLREVSMKVFQAGGIDSPLITKRRSRMCVGIKASHKSLLPEGVVLSVSSSGATYFMEPRDAIELNNMEVRLSNAEKAEEFAVLGFLTSAIACSEAKINHLMDRILELDLACARGAYAKWMNGICPDFTEDSDSIESNKAGDSLSVDIIGIQHPLLLEPFLKPFLSASSAESGSPTVLMQRDRSADTDRLQNAEVPVPLDFKIERTTTVVVISGPNTGGKTASMKTLGLASLMSKAGMFLPAKNRPKLPWYDQILADIGDHQSLEHNLSTFSGHISRLCKIIDVASKESLVLIDEIGSGTDPAEGVALSTSILQHFADCVNLAVVTTHYADLTHLKAADPRFENAAMEFCAATLQPTYRILWGSTGSSNALSIAKSIGFNQKVLDRAKEWVEKLVPDKQKERQGLLYQFLSEERSMLEAQAREASSILSEAEKLYREISSEAKDIERRELALKAKETHLVQQELRTVKSKMDGVIKRFENQLENTSQERLNLIMKEAEATIASIVAAHRPTDGMLLEEIEDNSSVIPRIGDKVFVKGLGNKLAKVAEVPAEDGTIMVQYGKVRLRVKRNDVRLVQNSGQDTSSSATRLKGQNQQRYRKNATLKADKDEEEAQFFSPAVQTSKNTVDLRGMRVEEAAHHLQMAISGCRAYGILFIVHGMGTGAVKERAMHILKNHPRVAKFEEENPMNYGCTIAYIN